MIVSSGVSVGKVILRAGEVAMMGLGVGILSHQNIPADKRQMERKRETFIKNTRLKHTNTVSHHNHQEVKCKTDLESLTLGQLHLSGFQCKAYLE